MQFSKETFVIGFALFAHFFGAGNLILPPYLGFFAGSEWYLVVLRLVISAVGLPLLGILAHARLQGSIFKFADKVSAVFSLIFCLGWLLPIVDRFCYSCNFSEERKCYKNKPPLQKLKRWFKFPH